MLISLINLLIFCFSTSSKPSGESARSYFITRIDSTGNYYLLYASRNDSTFEIASVKEATTTNCNKVKLNERYTFRLQSRIYQAGNITRQTNHHVECLTLDSITTVCFKKGSVRDLFFVDNLFGLCYDPSSKPREYFPKR
jgi:hypothetical protein